MKSVEKSNLLEVLKNRFEKNMNRHPHHIWTDILNKIEKNDKIIGQLSIMEDTQGEPDVVDFNQDSNEIIFCDCAPESPKGRRSLCYDDAALQSRKEHKPIDSAMNLAQKIGIEILDESLYRKLQSFGKFDTKTSSWLKTPDEIRSLGGAIFGDFRYGQVFIYHNGAESYYGVRGFRGILKVK